MSSRGEHLGHHQPPKLVQEAVLVEEELEKRERFHRLRELRRRAHSNPVSSFITKVIVFLIGSALILARDRHVGRPWTGDLGDPAGPRSAGHGVCVGRAHAPPAAPTRPRGPEMPPRWTPPYAAAASA